MFLLGGKDDLEQPQLLGSTSPHITMVLYPLELLPFWGTQLKLDNFFFSLQLFFWSSFCKKTKKPAEINHCHSSKDPSWQQLIFYTHKSNGGMWFYLFIFCNSKPAFCEHKRHNVWHNIVFLCDIFQSYSQGLLDLALFPKLKKFSVASLLRCEPLLAAF